MRKCFNNLKKDKCKTAFIEATKQELNFCLSDHCGYVANKNTNRATAYRLNLPGHSLADLPVIIIEQLKKNDTLYKKV